jgi:hypothetical protein
MCREIGQDVEFIRFASRVIAPDERRSGAAHTCAL